jgi:hypothetical protein
MTDDSFELYEKMRLGKDLLGLLDQWDVSIWLTKRGNLGYRRTPPLSMPDTIIDFIAVNRSILKATLRWEADRDYGEPLF